MMESRDLVSAGVFPAEAQLARPCFPNQKQTTQHLRNSDFWPQSQLIWHTGTRRENCVVLSLGLKPFLPTQMHGNLGVVGVSNKQDGDSKVHFSSWNRGLWYHGGESRNTEIQYWVPSSSTKRSRHMSPCFLAENSWRPRTLFRGGQKWIDNNNNK